VAGPKPAAAETVLQVQRPELIDTDHPSIGEWVIVESGMRFFLIAKSGSLPVSRSSLPAGTHPSSRRIYRTVVVLVLIHARPARYLTSLARHQVANGNPSLVEACTVPDRRSRARSRAARMISPAAATGPAPAPTTTLIFQACAP
jgi:hypothetical protein